MPLRFTGRSGRRQTQEPQRFAGVYGRCPAPWLGEQCGRRNQGDPGAGSDQLPEAVAADAGYWNEQHMDDVVAHQHIPVLVAPDKGTAAPPSAG